MPPRHDGYDGRNKDVADLLMAATRVAPVQPGQTLRPVRARRGRRRVRRAARSLARPVVRLATWLTS
jgi:hypothetical protein